MAVDEHTNKKKGMDKDMQVWWQPALMTFARLSGWIIGPVILGTLLGKWLDRMFGTEPWLFITTVGLAFIISMFGLGINVVKEYSKIEKETEEDLDNSNINKNNN
jgi:F0F1-type ATP synthase assembly protein I